MGTCKRAGYVLLAAAVLTVASAGMAWADELSPDDPVLDVLDSVLAELPPPPTTVPPPPGQPLFPPG